MKGRIESKIKSENHTKQMLKGMPQCVTDYYYSISVSLEPKTCDVYIYGIKSLIEFVGKSDVTTITDTDIARYLHSIETKTLKSGDIVETSFAYRKMTHSCLNGFFTYLDNVNAIESNPMKCIKRPRNADPVKRIKLTANDLAKIMECVNEDMNDPCNGYRRAWISRDKAILTLLISTGMRETALTEINVEDIDFENGSLTIIDKRHKQHVYNVTPKMEDVIKEWLRYRPALLNGSTTDALFISDRRSRISPKTVARMVAEYSNRAIGIKLSPHKFRAAFCTILYEQTGDIEFVREAVGHGSVSVTQKYIVKDGNARKRAADIMSNLI